MSKFKVGDKVKVVSLGKTVDEFGRGNNMISVGDTSFIKEVWNDGRVNLTDEYTYHEDDLELVSEPPTQSEEQPTKLYNPLFAQEGGGHYKDKGIQPIQYTMQNKLSFCEGNVVKYISRYKNKNGIEDLAKVVHYALLAAYEEYGEEGSTELKDKVLKLLGVGG